MFWGCFGGKIVRYLFSFGRLLPSFVVYATTKRGQKIAIRGRGVGCVGVRGRGGAWVRRAKAKKITAKQKKINPPYQKNSDFVLA